MCVCILFQTVRYLYFWERNYFIMSQCFRNSSHDENIADVSVTFSFFWDWVCHGGWYLFSPTLTNSASSIWRAANWSARPASSATSKSWREERWLRYQQSHILNQTKSRLTEPIAKCLILKCHQLWSPSHVLNVFTFFHFPFQTLTMGSTTLIRKSKKM